MIHYSKNAHVYTCIQCSFNHTAHCYNIDITSYNIEQWPQPEASALRTLTRRIAACTSWGQRLQNIPTAIPPALLPCRAVSSGWEYRARWRYSTQACRSYTEHMELCEQRCQLLFVCMGIMLMLLGLCMDHLSLACSKIRSLQLICAWLC